MSYTRLLTQPRIFNGGVTGHIHVKNSYLTPSIVWSHDCKILKGYNFWIHTFSKHLNRICLLQPFLTLYNSLALSDLKKTNKQYFFVTMYTKKVMNPLVLKHIREKTAGS